MDEKAVADETDNDHMQIRPIRSKVIILSDVAVDSDLHKAATIVEIVLEQPIASSYDRFYHQY